MISPRNEYFEHGGHTRRGTNNLSIAVFSNLDRDEKINLEALCRIINVSKSEQRTQNDRTF